MSKMSTIVQIKNLNAKIDIIVYGNYNIYINT